MRVLAIILTAMLLLAGTTAAAQATFECHEKNIPLRRVQVLIREQTGILLFFRNETWLLDRRVSLDVTSMTVEAFLRQYFGVRPGDYKIEGRTWFIKRKDPHFFAFSPAIPDTLENIRGIVTDMKGEPLAGVTISVENAGIMITTGMTTTDTAGSFILHQVDPAAILVCEHVSMSRLRAPLSGRTEVHLRMKEKPAELQNYNVTVPFTTGYQRVAKERATGSFGYVDQALVNRVTSTGIAERIENLVPGLLTNHGQSSGGIPIREMPTIRGRSTIFADPSPLLVVNNFPYDGDLNDLNPNDIESITVLKDAAAASIWGVRAGNGVIVINTRRTRSADSSYAGTLRPSMRYISNVTVQAAPDLASVPSISPADFIDWERTMFNGGFYTAGNSTPVTPVVDILTKAANGGIAGPTANAAITSMKAHDVRQDMQRYLYRAGLNQQHYFQAAASTEKAGYFVSGGWDHNLYGLRGTSYDRLSFRMQNTLRVSQPLILENSANYTCTTLRHNGNPGYNHRSVHGGKNYYPYARLATATGTPLPVSLDYSPEYLQGASQLGFLDWSYVPLQELDAESYSGKTHDLLINLGARYTFLPPLNLELRYQYQDARTDIDDIHTAGSYYARDLVNSFIQVQPSQNPYYPVKAGGILDNKELQTQSHQGRVQLNYNNTWRRHDHLAAIAGFEIRSLVNTGRSIKEYGYDPVTGSFDQGVKYNVLYTGWQMSTPVPIPPPAPATKHIDHFTSYYVNASWTLYDRYTLSASAREDLANLFGVRTNQKGVPLWSAGVAWQLSNERFFHVNALSSLKVRATYGRSGNISRLAAANTIASYSQTSITGGQTDIGYILGLANPALRWEQVSMMNIGLDIASRNRRITGSIEYYHKNGTDLMAPTPGDPTLGLIQTPGIPAFYFANSATISGSGIDIQLESQNLHRGALKWSTSFIFGSAVSRVGRYLVPVSTGYSYLDPGVISPRTGQPLFGIYSYRWNGLDPSNGDPVGFLHGKPGKDYASITLSTPIDSMVYHGPSQPTVFGALRNTFRWHAFSASVNISYKLGYYFRRPSISYTGLFSTWTGHSDYGRRWQHKGDEQHTSIPSLGYPGNEVRDRFYLNSSQLVERADHIRLEDIQLSYDLDKVHARWLPFDNIRLYTYVANIGCIWKANRSGIDPYYVNIPKDGRRYSLGIQVNF